MSQGQISGRNLPSPTLILFATEGPPQRQASARAALWTLILCSVALMLGYRA